MLMVKGDDVGADREGDESSFIIVATDLDIAANLSGRLVDIGGQDSKTHTERNGRLSGHAGQLTPAHHRHHRKVALGHDHNLVHSRGERRMVA